MASSSAGHTSPIPQNSSNNNSASAWSEPPWCGWIETTGDALLILEAARRGLIPRVTRRLVDAERKMITSGSVFVFDEDESGIKRWTDGFFWSPSRILGNFLLYRETDKRGGGGQRSGVGVGIGIGGVRADPSSPTASELSPVLVNENGQDLQLLSRTKSDSATGLDKHRERTLLGSLTNSYKFKADGMMKKTFSLTIGGVSQHLISYYKVEDVEKGRLRTPSSLPEIASLDISPEYLDKTHFRNPPKVELGVDGILRYRGEADETDHGHGHNNHNNNQVSGSAHHQHSGQHQADASGTMGRQTLPPMLMDGKDDGSDSPITPSTKRGKRFDPYGASSLAPGSSSKRSRKSRINTSSITNNNGEYTGQSTSPASYSPQTPYGSGPMSATSPPGDSINNGLSSPQQQQAHTMHYPAYSIPPPTHPHAGGYYGQMPMQMAGYPAAMYSVPPHLHPPTSQTPSNAASNDGGSNNPTPSPPQHNQAQSSSTNNNSPPPPSYSSPSPYSHDPNAASHYSYYPHPPPGHYPPPPHTYAGMPWPHYPPPPGYAMHPHTHAGVPHMAGIPVDDINDVNGNGNGGAPEEDSPEGDGIDDDV